MIFFPLSDLSGSVNRVFKELSNAILYWLTLAISKRQRRKALSLTAYTAVKSSKTEKNFVREYNHHAIGIRTMASGLRQLC